MGKSEPRASTTDAEARVMKMPDGGFRPGYNVQLATAGSPMGGSRTVVGVRVTNVGSDLGSVTPMLDEIERRTGQLPKTLLADANHAKHDCIVECAERGVEALVSVPVQPRTPGARVQADQRPAVLAWRERMTTEAAKTWLPRTRFALRALERAPQAPSRGGPGTRAGHSEGDLRGTALCAHRQSRDSRCGHARLAPWLAARNSQTHCRPREK